MSRVSVAERMQTVRLRWLRGVLAQGSLGRVATHPIVSWPFIVRQSRPAGDRAAGFAHHRRDACERNLCRPLRVRRQGRGLRCRARRSRCRRRPRIGLRRCSASAGCATCAPPSPASRRANARALVDEWITLQQLARRHRLAPRRDGAAHHLVAEPGAVGARRCRCRVLPPLHAQPHPAGAALAPHAWRCARRRTAPAGSDRARPTRHCAWRASSGTSARAHQAAVARSCSGRSCPTAAISAAIPARWSSSWSISCRCARCSPRATSPPPPALLNAIDRMMPMLRFFRHGDGNFALFNGMGPTPDRPAHDHPGL